MARAWMPAALVVCSLVAACGGGGSQGGATPSVTTTTATSPASTAPTDTGTLSPPAPADQASDDYGYSASSTGVDYQPDVVVVADGAHAVRAESADGLTYTLDPSAQGVSALAVGKILLATSQVAGRVVKVEDTAAGREVTLGPVDLGDVIQNGTIDLDQALSSADAVYRSAPDLPGAGSEPDSSDTGGISVQPAVAVRSDDAPPASTHSFSSTINGWKLTPRYSGSELGVGVEHEDAGLKVFGDLALTTDHLRIHGTESITGGSSGTSGFEIDGITGLKASISAGLGEKYANQKVRFAIPAEIDFPLPPSPATALLPVDIKLSFSFSVETALGGINSTLTAAGEYGLDGPIGYSDGTVLTPTFSLKKSIIDSIAGITIGVSGIVFAMKAKVQVGVGPPAFVAGPYGTVTAAIGLTNGSSLGASLARCHGATLDVEVGGGAGITIDSHVLDVLKDLLPEGTIPDLSVEAKATVLHKSQIVPDVPLCDSSAGGGG